MNKKLFNFLLAKDFGAPSHIINMLVNNELFIRIFVAQA